MRHRLETSEVGFEIAVDCYNTRAEVSLHGNGVSLQEFPMCYRTLVSGDQRIATGVKADRNRDLANSTNYLTPDDIMLIGIFADSHDHLDHIQRAVEVFNQAGCELVVFAGDLVSSFAVPPLRKLKDRKSVV